MAAEAARRPGRRGPAEGDSTTDPSPFCLRFLREFEELRLKVYLDQSGIPTIGYGHVLKPDEKYLSEITREQAEAMLAEDVAYAANEVALTLRNRAIEAKQYEFDALVSFTFNVGASKLRSSTLLQRLCAHDRLGAAHEFRRWHHSRGDDSEGLMRRRVAEELWFLGGHEDSIMNIATAVWG